MALSCNNILQNIPKSEREREGVLVRQAPVNCVRKSCLGKYPSEHTNEQRRAKHLAVNEIFNLINLELLSHV